MPVVETRFRTMYLVSHPPNSIQSPIKETIATNTISTTTADAATSTTPTIEDTIQAGPSSFNCPYCEEKFTNQNDLDTHIKTSHATSELHKCNKCSYTTQDANELINHKSSQHPTEEVNNELQNTTIQPDQEKSHTESNDTTASINPASTESVTVDDNLESTKSRQNKNIIRRKRAAPRYYAYPNVKLDTKKPTTKQKKVGEIADDAFILPKTAATLSKKKAIAFFAKQNKENPINILNRKRKNIPDYIDDEKDKDFEPPKKLKQSKRKLLDKPIPTRVSKRQKKVDTSLNKFFMA